jgi:hypothetical protein
LLDLKGAVLTAESKLRRAIAGDVPGRNAITEQETRK